MGEKPKKTSENDTRNIHVRVSANVIVKRSEPWRRMETEETCTRQVCRKGYACLTLRCDECKKQRFQNIITETKQKPLTGLGGLDGPFGSHRSGQRYVDAVYRCARREVGANTANIVHAH